MKPKQSKPTAIKPPHPGGNSAPTDSGADLPFTQEQQDLFTELDSEHRPWALNWARRWCYGQLDYEAAVNEALCTAMLRFDPSVAEFRVFLRWILFGELVDLLRKEQRRRRLLELLVANRCLLTHHQPTNPLWYWEWGQFLARALAVLKPKDLKQLVLCLAEELTPEEIAALLRYANRE